MPDPAATSNPALFQMGKTCKECKKVKPENAFHLKDRRGRRMKICGPCSWQRQLARGYRRAPETSESMLARKLLSRYKITLDQFRALNEAQNGVCAMCGKAPRPGTRLCVDHCHSSGVVRALLCTGCNVAVGVYENHHKAASAYLETYGAGNPLLKQ